MNELDTYSPSSCYSACTTAFISGKNRFLGLGANLAFHQYGMINKNLDAFDEVEKVRVEWQERDLQMFQRQGVNPEFLAKIFDAVSDDYWYPTDQLDARRQERRWEYEQNWFKWQELLILMIFGGKPLEAARRLLTYDHRTRDHDERGIIEALGLCGHADVLTALELIRDRCAEQHIIDEWFSAVHAIGNAEAGDRLLATLLEVSEQTDWRRSRSVSGMVAELAEKHMSLRGRVLGIASSGEQADLRKIAGVFRHVDQEEFLADLLALPGDRLEALSEAIADALRDLCVEHRPIDGSSGVNDVVPRPIRKFRARFFARASANDSGSAACTRLLEYIDQIREDYGEPAEEARHPDITIGQPWPAAARCAWEASAGVLSI